MKKIYVKPEMAIVEIEMEMILAASGNSRTILASEEPANDSYEVLSKEHNSGGWEEW